jgi:hypothetical protein
VALLIILVFFALDRAYMDGQNAAFIMSLVRRGAAVISDWANHLVGSLRR